MSYITFNELVALQNPHESIDELVSSISSLHNISSKESQEVVARIFKMESWYKFNRQLTATIKHRKLASKIYEGIQEAKRAFKVYKEPMMEEIPVKTFSFLNVSLKELYSYQSSVLYLLDRFIYRGNWCIDPGNNDEFESSKTEFIEWLLYFNARLYPSLGEQITSYFVYLKVSGDPFSVGDLMDHRASMHCYLRASHDRKEIFLSEFSKSVEVLSSPDRLAVHNVQNYMIQQRQFFEELVIFIIHSLKDFGVESININFNCSDVDFLYQKLIEETKLSSLHHEYYPQKIPGMDFMQYFDIKFSTHQNDS
ncbi:hypothetical protein [Algicola sagamiensis]|uniref:hypothetical protein n=1 Tax=Algicola sagamiensis TaxID=163869 RepID=UPI00036FABBE|nr:hypothetical protein [Algicola sagamiensis]